MQIKKTILSFLVLFTVNLNAQNAADVDLVIGNGFVGHHWIGEMAVQADGKIVVAGYFFDNGNGWPNQCKVMRYNSDGSADISFPIILFSQNANVQDLLIQPDGKILIAGNFSKMNNQTVGSLVRLNSDGSRDTSFQSFTQIVNSIALQPDGKIIVGGGGNYAVNSHSQYNLVRLNTNGSIDPSFDFGFQGFTLQSMIYKVAVQPDGKILAGGYFTLFNGAPQGKLIRFNSNGTKDTTFDIGVGSTDIGILNDIALLPDGKILICGGFGLWNGQAFGHLCKLNPNGSIDTSFVSMYSSLPGVEGPNGIVLQTDGKIVVMGDHQTNNQTHRLSRLNTDGTQDATFTADADNTLNCIKIQPDDKILLGGFMSYSRSDIIKNGIVRLISDGSVDPTFNSNTGLNNEVNAIALQTTDKTILGGNFTKFNGVDQGRIIRINNADGTRDSTFAIGVGFNGAVRSIAVQSDGKLLVGGSFTQFNGQTAPYLIRLNENGTRDSSFTIGTGFNNPVHAIQLQPDGKIIIGGRFTTFNGLQQNHLIRLNSDGTKDQNFGTGNAFDNTINAIALLPNGRIIVGGSFNAFNGQTQSRLIVLNNDGTKDLGFVLPFELFTDVTDIALQPDGKFIIAANFVYRFEPNGVFDANFNTNISNFTTLNLGDATTIAVQDNGKILIGGSFLLFNQRPNRIVRINSDGTKDSSFDSSVNNDSSLELYTNGFTEGACNDIVIQPDKKIWIGGSFFHYKGTTSFSAIRLRGDTVLGIEDPEMAGNTISVYPNPVKEVMHLSTIAKSIEVFDVSGKFLGHRENSDRIDFTLYSPGIYLIRIELENGTTTTKKVVKN